MMIYDSLEISPMVEKAKKKTYRLQQTSKKNKFFFEIKLDLWIGVLLQMFGDAYVHAMFGLFYSLENTRKYLLPNCILNDNAYDYHIQISYIGIIIIRSAANTLLEGA